METPNCCYKNTLIGKHNMVRVLDLPTGNAAGLSSSNNYLLVSGYSSDQGVKRVSVSEFTSFFDAATSVNLAGVNSAIDTRVNSAFINSVGTAIPFSNIASKPTTVSGYGITDAVQFGNISVSTNGATTGVASLSYDGNGTFSFTPSVDTSDFAELNNKPTTISGYGITDAVVNFADLGSKPTTLSGYGIGAQDPALVYVEDEGVQPAADATTVINFTGSGVSVTGTGPTRIVAIRDVSVNFKAAVAASTSFADFKTRVAALSV